MDKEQGFSSQQACGEAGVGTRLFSSSFAPALGAKINYKNLLSGKITPYIQPIGIEY